MSGQYRIEKWTASDAPTGKALRTQMEADGYNVFEWSDRPGITYGMHRHDDDQSHCIISGQIEFTVENEGTFVLGPGDRDFLPAGTLHSARVVGEEVVFYLIGAKN
ncbi:MAG TPA: cupin domain-containing protein [Pyrinomonadaceae bacterium]|jgi:quercetin dioxygenase-like cupin family protein|nr:cupin domain-containing protein [Pyrinomonadaceae bacterium]